MPKLASQVTRRVALVGYTGVLLALLLVVLATVWGARRAVADTRRTLLSAEFTRLRSHAKRSVGRLESLLENQPETPPVDVLQQAQWLREFWSSVVPRENQRLHAAVVDQNGKVLLHIDPGRENSILGPRWFEHVVDDPQDDVVLTRLPALTGGRLAYDIHAPIEITAGVVGSYHLGFDAAWLDGIVSNRAEAVYIRWAVAGGFIILVMLIAGGALFHLARHASALEQVVAMSRARRFAELGRLVGGLAHEIRNPLNAIRLNLHTLKRSADKNNGGRLGRLTELIEESNSEIARLEDLVRTVLDYGRPEQPKVEQFDLGREIRASIEFVEQLLTREGISVSVDVPETPIVVAMDHNRLRQIMLNLLNNAREALPPGGEVRIELERRDDWADLTVTDTGPGIPDGDIEKVFDPFYTTKQGGCGLGLALVRRFVEEAGGAVAYERHNASGARFRVSLPAVEPERKE